MMNIVSQKSIPIAFPSERSVRVTNHVGMILALVSFTMMFLGLFYAYGLLRIRAVAWPPPGVPQASLVVPSLITVMMMASSVAVEAARKQIQTADMRRFQRFALSAIVLGTLFIGLQAGVWVDLWESGLTLAIGPYASLFYFLTAFHALHVLAGLGILIWMYVAVPRASHPEIRGSRAQVASMFWHFVGAVWLVIFSLVYVF